MNEGAVLAVFFIVALAGIAVLTYPAMNGMMARGSEQFLPAPVRNIQPTQGITMVPAKCTEKYANHPLCAHCFDVSVENNDKMCVQALVPPRIKDRYFFVDETGTINFTAPKTAQVSDSPISG